jgi:hypothetical protein
MYLPKREELSLRVVLALPKDSRIGFVARICRSTSLASSALLTLVLEGSELTDARYLIRSFAWMQVSYAAVANVGDTYRFSFPCTTVRELMFVV